MSIRQIEERVDALERQVARLMQSRGDVEITQPWWKLVAGRFADDPEFDEAMRLGREYRDSLRPSDAQDAQP